MGTLLVGKRPSLQFKSCSRRKFSGRCRAERLGLWPKREYDKEAALQVQLQSLQLNNTPYRDHGIEVLYRFAAFDPFQRTRYFGKSLDLGQFERFKRVFFTPWFQPLLGYTEYETLSQLSVNKHMWRTRLLVKYGLQGEQEAVYEVTMIQKLEGVHAGLWLTSSVIRDDVDGTKSYL